jgi:outer membrane biosynthesis protein TonB
LRFSVFPISRLFIMSGTNKKLAIVVLALLAVLSGCKKKKPPVPQPQTQAPTITEPQPQPQPPAQPQPQPPVTTVPPPEPQPSTATIPKPKPHKRHVAKKPVPAPEKNKTTVKEGGETAPTGQLSAGIPPTEATRQRQTAAQLRQNTENSLRSITRQLSSDEQAMVQQIRTYNAQSRSAENDGDTERAYNLALKANLLTGELIKR